MVKDNNSKDVTRQCVIIRSDFISNAVVSKSENVVVGGLRQGLTLSSSHEDRGHFVMYGIRNQIPSTRTYMVLSGKKSVWGDVDQNFLAGTGARSWI